jgi:hypothetical protein
MRLSVPDVEITFCLFALTTACVFINWANGKMSMDSASWYVLVLGCLAVSICDGVFIWAGSANRQSLQRQLSLHSAFRNDVQDKKANIQTLERIPST